MRSFKILGVRVDDVSYEQTTDFINQVIKEGKKAQIATVNNEFIVEAQKNKAFRSVLANTSLNVADSMGVVWAVKKLYKEMISRTSGADLFLKICDQAKREKYRIFFLGGASGVGDLAKKKLLKRFPGIHIVGTIDGGKINENKIDEILNKTINQTHPDIIFVALGAPKQDIWIANNLGAISAKVFIGVGGTLDYVSGKTIRAPKFLRAIGLEWLFRVILQPKRIGRIYRALIVFPYLVRKNSGV